MTTKRHSYVSRQRDSLTLALVRNLDPLPTMGALTNMVELVNVSGVRFFVSPRHIARVKAVGAGTQINMADGTNEVVCDDVEDIATIVMMACEAVEDSLVAYRKARRLSEVA